MNVQITDSFTKSLKRLIWHESRIYRFYSVFRYDIPLFIKNVWKFRKELRTHQWWDYRFTLEMLYRSLTIVENGMSSNGWEVRETRDPKLKAMRRALEILKYKLDDDYVTRAETELGMLSKWDWEFEDIADGGYRLIDNQPEEDKKRDREIFDRATQMENDEWIELWDILKGTKFSKKYGKNYDGTDMRSWWD